MPGAKVISVRHPMMSIWAPGRFTMMLAPCEFPPRCSGAGGSGSLPGGGRPDSPANGPTAGSGCQSEASSVACPSPDTSIVIQASAVPRRERRTGRLIRWIPALSRIVPPGPMDPAAASSEARGLSTVPGLASWPTGQGKGGHEQEREGGTTQHGNIGVGIGIDDEGFLRRGTSRRALLIEQSADCPIEGMKAHSRSHDSAGFSHEIPVIQTGQIILLNPPTPRTLPIGSAGGRPDRRPIAEPSTPPLFPCSNRVTCWPDPSWR